MPQNPVTDDIRASDVLVIGSGIAGLYYALQVAEHAHVSLVTKKAAADSATNWAQGGIAAVLAPDDTFESHVQDTLDAGAGLADRAESVVVDAIDVGERGVFGHPDTLENQHSAGVEELGDGRVQGRRTGNGIEHALAEQRSNLAEHEFVGDAMARSEKPRYRTVRL